MNTKPEERGLPQAPKLLLISDYDSSSTLVRALGNILYFQLKGGTASQPI